MRKLTLFLAALLFSVSAFALTPAQDAALKGAMLADQSLAAAIAGGDDVTVLNWANLTTTFIVWKSSLDPDSMRQGMVDGASQLDNLTVGKRDTLFYLFAGTLPNTAALRTAIDGLCGTQSTLKAGLDAQEYRAANKAESILAIGTGTSAAPGTLTFEGFLTLSDISRILRGS